MFEHVDAVQLKLQFEPALHTPLHVEVRHEVVQTAYSGQLVEHVPSVQLVRHVLFELHEVAQWVALTQSY